MRERPGNQAPKEQVGTETLRQKDRILTDIWRARILRHRRGNADICLENSQVKKTEANTQASVFLFVCQ
jgi:hypothetical protein